MTTLRPLRDDPATAEALRRALQREAELPALTDATALKAAVVGKVLSGTGAASAAGAAGLGLAGKLGLAGAALVVAAGGALWWQGQADDERTLVDTAIRVPAPQTPVPAEAPSAPVQPAQMPAGLDDAVPPDVAPDQPRVANLVPRPAPRNPRNPAAPPATAVPPAPALPAAPVVASAASASPSQLAAQLALYDRGREALQRGAYAESAILFETYLADYPAGALEIEASLSLLEAHMRAAKHARVATLASALARRSELVGRRGELLRAQGEALARLGRCDEAEQVLERAQREADARLTTAQVEAAVASCRAPDSELP